MLYLKNIARLITLLSFFISSLSLAISKELKATVDWETKGNAVAVRNNAAVAIQNYEIPIRLLNYDIDKNIAPGTRDSLVFEKNGEKYVRWIINPEDTKWHLEVEEFLKSKSASVKKHQFFTGYQTASRSYIVVNPETGAEFSAKVSTNVTGGNWTDKKQTYEDATQIRMIMKHINTQVQRTGELKRSILLDEPAIFGIKSIDQGMVIRSYDNIANTGYRYVPGFSIVNEKVGRELALKNGSSDPATYWNEHYNKPLARALAEFIVATGVAYDSPHSQNFMVEIDPNDKPTGRIVLRDFGDSYINTKFMNALKLDFIAAKWEQDNLKHDYIPAGVGILHGNSDPSWINTVAKSASDSSYDKWGADFYFEFEKEMKLQTGFILESHVGGYSRAGKYFNNFYSLNKTNGLKFLDLVSKGLQRSNFANNFCSHIFSL